jgi:hypothetical protein
LLIPLAFTIGVVLLLKKIPSSPKAFRVAWAVQAGHALWMAFGAMLTGEWIKIAPDIAIFATGLAWLWVRPGLGPVILLSLYQLAAGIYNFTMLMHMHIATTQHKALVAHLSLRIFAVIFLIAGYVTTRKQQNETHTT